MEEKESIETGIEIRNPFFIYLLPWGQFMSDKLLGGKASAEATLKFAVFMNGLHEYWKDAAYPALHNTHEFLEEEAWVLAEDTEWPFSFVNLCNDFGIVSKSLRRVLVEWKNHR